MKAKHLWLALVACVLLLIPAFLATPAQATETIPEGLEYSVSNGEVTITGYTGTTTDLVIPSEIEGCAVTAIGRSAFRSNKILQNVTIPNSVTLIDAEAFAYSEIKEIIVPKSVTWICFRAFYSPYLERIIFEGNCPHLCRYSLGGALVCTCWDYDSDVNPRCTSNKDVLPEDTFGDDEYEEDYSNYALYMYNRATEIQIPAGDTSWDETVKNSSLLNWGRYSCVPEGLQYTINNDEVTITGYTGTATELEIPSEIDGYPVTTIKVYAFSGCSTLENVTIPESVTYMGELVFKDCKNLKEVWLYCHPDAVIWKFVQGDIIPEDCFCDESPFCVHGNGLIPGTFAFIGSSTGTSVYISVDYISLVDEYDGDMKLCYFGTTQDGLEYRICSEEVMITKYSGNVSEFMIPQYILDYPVKSIADCAFSGNTTLKTLVFPGEAPNISPNAFAGAKLTIQFPADDASWQNAAMKNYGGTLSWAPYGNPKFTTASLVLKDNLNIRFSVDAAAFENGVYNSPKVVFTIGNATQTVDSHTVSDGKYLFVCDNISPSQIGDVVQAELYAIYFGEEVKLQTMEYGVATYCYNMLAKTEDDYLRTLLVDLLNYGSAAQKYAGYKTGSLSNSLLTEEQKRWGSAEELELGSVLSTKYQTVKNAKATWKAAGLVLENSVTMRFRFEAESIENLSVKIVADGQEWNVTDFEPVPGKAGQYYVYFTGLSARQMRENVFVTVYEGDTRVSNTLRYSVETYAYNKQNDANTKLADLVKAMMRYGISAENYLN